MFDKSDGFWIAPEHRAACEVYAVAIGDRLGIDIDNLRMLRSCVDDSMPSGSEELDSILRFVADLARNHKLGDYPVPGDLARAESVVVRAYCHVARLIQPLTVDP